MRRLRVVALVVALHAWPACAQDRFPLPDSHVWLPMTGVTTEQMDDAVAAGYNTILLKLHPPVSGDNIDFGVHAAVIEQATTRGLKLMLAILGWMPLGAGGYYDVAADGTRIEGQLDPFWPEAFARMAWYYERVIDHYDAVPEVVAYAPTWGIYGEAGLSQPDAGYSPHALARFNEWLAAQGLPAVDALPSKAHGPNSDYNRFIRFRYLYLEAQFTPLIARLKTRTTRPVGMWQELYAVAGYLWTMVRVSTADFALYEACLSYQTSHDPTRTLAEAMGFRYRCRSADEFRDYFLPLMARKRGEGQRFMGCQLSNQYAVTNYGWTEEEAAARRFDRWEDHVSPSIRALHQVALEAPERDVLLIFPQYGAAALPDDPVHNADTVLLDTLLRMHGCQLDRFGLPRVDAMPRAELDRYRLIVAPNAAYLQRETLDKLLDCRAHLLTTGALAQALDGDQAGHGATRSLDGATLRYLRRPAGALRVTSEHDTLTAGLRERLRERPVTLPADDAFAYEDGDATVLLRAGGEPVLSARRNGRVVHLHGQVFAGLCYNPARRPPALGGSQDHSANEFDIWGPYDSAHPNNDCGALLLRNILDHAGVAYRIPDPPPRTWTPYLSDHMEQVGLSANLAYNNTAETQTIAVRLPWSPSNHAFTRDGAWYRGTVTIAPFAYTVLER